MTAAPDLPAIVRGNLVLGERRALRYRDTWFDWAWIAAIADALAGFRAASGIGLHAGAALVARNRPPHVAALLAQFAARAPTQMVYSSQANAGIVADLEMLAPPVILADAEDWSPALIDLARRQGVLGISFGTGHALPDIVNAPTAQHRDDAPPSDIALELLSSGTTGKPKRLPLSWRALGAVVADAKAVYEDPGASGAEPTPAIVIHPLGNVSGINYVAGPMAVGQPIVLFERFEVAGWVDAVEQFRPIRAALPPTGLRMVFDADIAPDRLASLAAIGTGGGPLDPALKHAFEERYDLAIFPGYGATEFGGVVASWTLDLHREFGTAKSGSSGRARPGVELRVLDPDTGQVVPAGAVGILHARVDRIGDDWIATTDRATIDADGFLFLHGRSDGAIIRGGFKIQPDAVAAVLREHPDVADAAVIGIADARLGQVPVAAVEPRGGHAIDIDTLKAFARERLLAYQLPVAFRIVPALPRNAAMKVSLVDVAGLFTG